MIAISPAGAGAAALATGTYVGNGQSNRVFSGLGFSPSWVTIKSSSPVPAVTRTTTMPLGYSKGMLSSTAIALNQLQSLDGDGFTVGTSTGVNAAGVTYWWVAAKAVAGQLVVGKYLGTAADNQLVSSVGFQPDFVIVLPETSIPGVWRISAMPGDASTFFNSAALFTDAIQAMRATGFEVGLSGSVNGAGAPFHYIAGRNQPQSIAVGTYTGLGTNNRDILGLGFAPEYVLLKGDNHRALSHPLSLGAMTNLSLMFDDDTTMVGAIAALLPNGFRVGSSPNANEGGTAYWWIALGPGLDGGPDDAGVDAGAQSDGGASDGGELPSDGGPEMDGGDSDGGDSDGGSSDGGARLKARSLAVGCSCASTRLDSTSWLAALALCLVARSHRRGAQSRQRSRQSASGGTRRRR